MTADLIPFVVLVVAIMAVFVRLGRVVRIGRQILENQSEIISGDRADAALLGKIAKRLSVND